MRLSCGYHARDALNMVVIVSFAAQKIVVLDLFVTIVVGLMQLLLNKLLNPGSYADVI